MKLSVGAVKFVRLGKMVGRSVAATPNHWANVAAYGSREVVGTQRPWPVASSGPLATRVGKIP